MPKKWTTLAATTAAAALWASPGAYAASISGYLYQGQSTPEVRLLQSDLAHLGYPVAATGYFGPVTESAVKNFQTLHGLSVDGIVGPQTESALNSALNSGPAPMAAVAVDVSGEQYTVKPGDTLDGIATRFGTTVAALVQANHLANPNWLSVGQVLTIPGSGSAPAPSSPASASSAGSGQYVVKPGDTLGSIAARFGVSWQTLADINHLANPNRIYVGETLSLPSGTGSQNASANATQTSTSASVNLPVQAPANSFGQAIVDTALKYLGVPYAWGGASPSGFDCSGLVQYVFGQNGVNLPHSSWGQYARVVPVSRQNLQPGDLVFFSTYASGPSHVGIYLGADPALGYSQAFIDSPAPGQGVHVMNLNSPYWQSHWYGAGAIVP